MPGPSKQHTAPTRDRPSAPLVAGPSSGQGHHTVRYRGTHAGPDAQRLLRIYLGDHFAGATAGRSLARRIARNHKDSPYGRELSGFADAVTQDRKTLRRILDDLGFSPPPAKYALAWVGEQAGRLKPNGRLIGRSPLSDAMELEIMRMGVEGKASCWRSLRALADYDARLSASELDRLVERAEQQAQRLEQLRIAFAAAAFRATDEGAGGPKRGGSGPQ